MGNLQSTRPNGFDLTVETFECCRCLMNVPNKIVRVALRRIVVDRALDYFAQLVFSIGRSD